jgi:hypothetical protein
VSLTGLPIADGARIFLFFMAFRSSLRPTKPTVQRVHEIIFPGIKRPEREADHSSPYSAEVKNDADINLLTYSSSRRDAYLFAGA